MVLRVLRAIQYNTSMKNGILLDRVIKVISQSIYFILFYFFIFNLFIFIYLFIFLAVLGLRFVRGLSLVAASGGHSSSRCAGLSLSRPLQLRGTGSRRAGSAAVAHGPSRSAACGIFPDQGSNPCPLNQQADSQPLRHQGSPRAFILNVRMTYIIVSTGATLPVKIFNGKIKR